MIIVLDLLLIAVGFFLLIKGATWLVDGASTLALRWGASDLLVGLTVVSIGTSTPELLVNLVAAWNKSTDLALANIVGSCIANVFFILGISALIAPLAVARSTVFKEIPFCLLASLVVGIVANDVAIDGAAANAVTRTDGLVLLGFCSVFLYYLASLHKAPSNDANTTQPSEISGARVSPQLLVGLGLVVLVAGGEMTVQGGTHLAQELGASERLIGLTIIAIGTSLPELLTSVVATLKRRVDISIGNVVGSNIFNLFWILGVSSSVTPLPVSSALNTDIAVMIASVILLLIFIQPGSFSERLRFWRIQRGHVLNRLEGGILLSLYFLYIGVSITLSH
jgi:cation:H+ antiporter